MSVCVCGCHVPRSVGKGAAQMGAIQMANGGGLLLIADRWRLSGLFAPSTVLIISRASNAALIT